MAHYGTNRVPKWRAAAAVAIVTGLAFAGAQALAASNAAPKPSAVPTVEGKFQVGETVSATPGTWANAPTEFNYQWLRCNASGGGCANFASATSKKYKLGKADVDHTVRVAVTAQNADGKATGRSHASPLVSDSEAPRDTTRPAISGKAQIGESLTVSTGSWTGGVRAYAFQWQRCDRQGNNCTDVAGATAKTYGVRNADAGYTLRAEVTARNDAGRTTVNTDRSEVIQQAPGTTTTVTTTATTTVPGNRAPSVRLLSLRVRRNRVYVRVRVCDDAPGRIRITTREQMARRLAYTRRFSVRVFSCAVYRRSWQLIPRFRATHRKFVVTMRASDGNGRLSRLASRSVVLR